MKASMYTFSVPVFVKTLGNLSAILCKGAAFAEQKKVDPAVLLAMRLAPDMFPLTMQVRIACDFAKGAVARLAGEEPPKWEPVIGRHPAYANVWVATGYYRYGVTMAPASSRLLAELMLGTPPHLDPAPYAWEAAQSRSWRGDAAC